MFRFVLSFVFLAFSSHSLASNLVRQLVNPDGSIEVLSIKEIHSPMSVKQRYKLLPEKIVEGRDHNQIQQSSIEEWIVSDAELKKLGLMDFSRNSNSREVWIDSEVRALVVTGDPRNRIDLPIVAEGYTLAEKEKFFADAERIRSELFSGSTFQSYSALFNVYAVFVPSVDSGVTDTVQRDTALGLYRSPANSKRAILYDSTAAIERAIALAPDDDYPILLVNDDYYGGLGGRYAITTRSETTGIIVLRHELGHNFSAVGEEYDGGGVYSGANFSSSANVPWKHWMTSNKVEVFESKFISGQYLWKNLKEGPITSDFTFPPGDFDFDMEISSVGWSSPQDVEFSINGIVKTLTGFFTGDRSFFQLAEPLALSPGRHTMRFEEKIKDGDNILAFAMTYAQPKNLKREEFYGAYSTFDQNEVRRGYRPTFKSCLMRDMSSSSFCAVDRENMWIRFLNVVNLIDGVKVEGSGDQKIAKLQTVDLDGLLISWYKKSGANWTLLEGSGNSISVSGAGKATYKVVVEFKTDEVRKPGQRFISEKEFVVSN